MRFPNLSNYAGLPSRAGGGHFLLDSQSIVLAPFGLMHCAIAIKDTLPISPAIAKTYNFYALLCIL